MSKIEINTFSELISKGISPEVLFWVGCAGSFDDRAKKITKAFARILNQANVSFAVLEVRRDVLAIQQSVQETSFYFKCKHYQISKF